MLFLHSEACQVLVYPNEMRADHTSFLFELRCAATTKFVQYVCLFSLVVTHRFLYLICHVRMDRSAKETRNTRNSGEAPGRSKDRSSNSPLTRPRRQFRKPAFRTPQSNAAANASSQVHYAHANSSYIVLAISIMLT